MIRTVMVALGFLFLFSQVGGAMSQIDFRGKF